MPSRFDLKKLMPLKLAHSDVQQTPGEPTVICVCGGFGFPNGMGSSARIIMVGKALQMQRVGFRVLHCGPSPLATNTQSSGVFEGIPFDYTTTVRRPANAVARWVVYGRAVLELSIRLLWFRLTDDRVVVWLYIIDGPLNLYVGRLSRTLGLPVVQELCEWPPGYTACSRFTRWLYRAPLFRNATGVLAISRLIERRARETALAANLQLRIHRLPAIVDAGRFSAFPATTPPTDRTFVWCGTEDWYRDVLFLIRATALLRRQGHCPVLVVIGSWSAARRLMLEGYAKIHGLPSEALVVTGYVDEAKLKTLLNSATALLLPLSDDDRSRTRMPNKLPEYLATGRPVVTCEVGDLTDFLEDGVSAYLAKPGDLRSFADKMALVFKEEAAADRVGEEGKRACLAQLDYRVHANVLAKFFRECTKAPADCPLIDVARVKGPYE